MIPPNLPHPGAPHQGLHQWAHPTVLRPPVLSSSLGCLGLVARVRHAGGKEHGLQDESTIEFQAQWLSTGAFSWLSQTRHRRRAHKLFQVVFKVLSGLGRWGREKNLGL